MEEYIDSEVILETAIGFGAQVLLALVTLVIGFWIAGRIGRVMRNRLQKRSVDPTVIPFFTKLITVGLKILVLISVAGVFGIQTTSFVAVIGAAAFAIGLALQGTLGHFASGVLLLIFKPFKVGDSVSVQGVMGTVREVGIFQTIIHTFDNQKVYIPNGVITGGTITNISVTGELRTDWTFGIGYGDDIDKARSIIKNLLENHEAVIKEKPIDIFVSELADSSVNFKVRCWTKTEHKWPVYFYLIEEVKKAFDKEGVNIPYPQMDVHLDKLNN
ncbi:MAG: mechanosensitive ion channel family protein [Saprospirales bacterium]|nr:MAG: mechanosensitive ion channel family protein [Saprospirales bacterium]